MVNRILGIEDLQGFAEDLSARLKPGMALFLNGPLGAGKTTLARALIQSLAGAGTEVASPTFPLCLIYETDGPTVWHYDLYRLNPNADLEELNWTEARRDGIAIVEWVERARPDQIRAPYIVVDLDFADEDEKRTVSVREVLA